MHHEWRPRALQLSTILVKSLCRAEGGVLVDGATVRPLSPKERFNQSASLVRRIKEICDLTAGTLERLLAPYPACECIGQFDETGSVEWAL